MDADAAKLPRSVRKGPPITVSCECGSKRDLRYGERWRCEDCGRRYDTNRIPMEEYAELRRARVRDRVLPTIVFVALAAIVLVSALLGRALAGILVVATVGFVWGSFVRPVRRRRQYRAIAERPRWKIRAD